MFSFRNNNTYHAKFLSSFITCQAQLKAISLTFGVVLVQIYKGSNFGKITFKNASSNGSLHCRTACFTNSALATQHGFELRGTHKQMHVCAEFMWLKAART